VFDDEYSSSSFNCVVLSFYCYKSIIKSAVDAIYMSGSCVWDHPLKYKGHAKPMMEAQSQTYLDNYLATLTPAERNNYSSFSADYFCADEHNANVCASLIRQGQKTATCSLKFAFEAENSPLPSVGHLMVVTDWHATPICIVEVNAVSECTFAKVSAEFAYQEGEGDRSLASWRETHWDFFTQECVSLGIAPSEEMILVLEHFHVVHQ